MLHASIKTAPVGSYKVDYDLFTFQYASIKTVDAVICFHVR